MLAFLKSSTCRWYKPEPPSSQKGYLLTSPIKLEVCMNQTVTQYQCTCEQSFCVFMWKLGPGLIVSWAAGRAYRDTEVHLSPINLCLFLCVSVDAGDELWTESRLAHMLSAEPWNDSLKKVSFFFPFQSFTLVGCYWAQFQQLIALWSSLWHKQWCTSCHDACC